MTRINQGAKLSPGGTNKYAARVGFLLVWAKKAIANRSRKPPLFGKAGDGVALLDHLHDREAFFRECSGGAGMDAFTAGGAVDRLAPIVFEVADDTRVDAARGYLPNVCAFDLRADTDATRAEDAAVLIEDEAGVSHVHGEAGIVVPVADMCDAQLAGQRLKLAVAVTDAGGADVVAFDEEQFDGHLAIEGQLGRGGLDRHAFLHGRGAGWQKTVSARQLDHADAAGSHGAEALEIAERRNFLSVVAGRFQNRLAFFGADQFAINSD